MNGTHTPDHNRDGSVVLRIHAEVVEIEPSPEGSPRQLPVGKRHGSIIEAAKSVQNNKHEPAHARRKRRELAGCDFFRLYGRDATARRSGLGALFELGVSRHGLLTGKTANEAQHYEKHHHKLGMALSFIA
jgi:hypothetical protein